MPHLLITAVLLLLLINAVHNRDDLIGAVEGRRIVMQCLQGYLIAHFEGGLAVKFLVGDTDNQVVVVILGILLDRQAEIAVKSLVNNDHPFGTGCV